MTVPSTVVTQNLKVLLVVLVVPVVAIVAGECNIIIAILIRFMYDHVRMIL